MCSLLSMKLLDSEHFWTKSDLKSTYNCNNSTLHDGIDQLYTFLLKRHKYIDQLDQRKYLLFLNIIYTSILKIWKKNLVFF